jgi:hypothetical protein
MKTIKNLRNTFYLLLFIFIPLFILDVITSSNFYGEVICGDEICKIDGWHNESHYILDNHTYHYSNRHWILWVFELVGFVAYVISLVVYYMKITFPKTYKEIVEI